MVILESMTSAHKCVNNVLLSISEYANDSFKENSREERESFVETLVELCFVELENHECMKVLMEKIAKLSPHT